VLDAVISSLSVGEVNLFRQLRTNLESGDVALGEASPELSESSVPTLTFAG